MIENIDEKQAEAPVPGSPDYPLHSELTIGAYLKQQVAIDPDHEFVVYPDRDLRWTYKDFDERTDALATMANCGEVQASHTRSRRPVAAPGSSVSRISKQ